MREPLTVLCSQPPRPAAADHRDDSTACRLVTNITSTLPAGAVLDVVLWVYKNQRTTQTGSSASMLWASRDASTTCAKGACDDSIKRIRTVIQPL